MTMFSMKPQFNLAEFLAVPASRGARRRGMQFKPVATSEDAAGPTPSKEQDSSDAPDK